ncbi:hypothetical protein A2907_02630 [Candidatus Azambacteria bacterium RIFCSPLOWO2_01_FULL_37_9]|uniref:Uncharacterized protein n=1 Tax=Candidatus Azambacteria bacterium RIFCSPLOWO2_01_FULL_37_9 TaxID=1797297 RepID=A0A1F5C727_9BACT|nr:MAG: hypothetical protein US56_C0007G0007 [Candidatus Moranbacteria bacterium GW2011_GWF2_37_7]KKQ42678.1 MAG: hypothetical protein US61_C0023G0009 [Parcubacteria group bacterium GW2011_GWE2_37_8]OGD38658.1 MAG: hypothetical protein A2907_02630 [Candidatus Azambacteria bacterium RIFCSPLOWO2_01_FULL_37_9]
MDDTRIKLITSIIKSAIFTVIFVAAITITADLAPDLKNWLKSVFTHHWIGKSILTLIFFLIFSIVVYLCPCQKNIEKTKKLLSYLLWSSMGSAVIIFLFFIWEAFLK